jgi:hypothetical protein
MDQQHGLLLADECDLLLDQIEEKLKGMLALAEHLDQLFVARHDNDPVAVERALHNLQVIIAS